MNSFALDNMRNTNFGEAAQPTSQQPKVPAQRKGARQIVSRFFHYTTINGLQRLASAKTIIGRMFWIAVVLGALAMFSREIYDIVDQYFDRPVSVVSKINYFRKMDFPAITVCNVNPIKKQILLDDQNINGLNASVNKRKNDQCFKEDLRAMNAGCNSDEDEFDNFDDEINYLLANTKESTLRKNGHQRNDFIVSCRFGGIRCRDKAYWTQFWDPKYGNCYTFNSRLTGYDPEVSLFSARKPGSSYGLKLMFNIEVQEYIPEITQDAGIKLTITGPSKMPFPLYESISLAPGFKTDIALKRINIKRKDRFNNGSCRVNEQLEENNHYRKKYNATYNVQACLQYCYSRSQIAMCGCAKYTYFTATPNGKVCDETNNNIEKCLNTWEDASDACDGSCKEPCEETIYEQSLSFTKWPTPQSVEIVLESLGKNFTEYNSNVQNVRNNYLAANIFFQRFRESKIEETLSYGTANLLADIGGQIGLWAGLSVISMCELLELFALLLRYFLRGKRQSNPN